MCVFRLSDTFSPSFLLFGSELKGVLNKLTELARPNREDPLAFL